MTPRKIYNWSIFLSGGPYTAPELRTQKVAGLADSEDSDRWIETSSIVGQRDGYIVTKSGSLYQLETVSEEYESLYPDARSRLFESLPKV